MKEKKTNTTIESVYKDFVEGYEYLRKPNPFFQLEQGGDVVNVSPIGYWNEGRKVLNALVKNSNRKASEKWKSNYSTGLARNKILGLLAHVVSQYISPTIMAQNKKQAIDKAASKFVKDILEHSLDKEKFEVTQFFATLTAIAEGTCILEDNHFELKRRVKDITDIDHETGKTVWKEKEVEVWKGPRFTIIPNDQFIVQNPYARDLDDNDWVIVFYRGTKAYMSRFFGSYAKLDEVEGGLITGWASEEDDKFKQFKEQITLQQNEVVVIKRYNLVNDTMDIIANGVQLTDEGNPIPRPTSKKRYPIVMLYGEPIDSDFYLGKSIADRLSKEQSAIDLLHRMIFDREYLNTFPPMETDDESLLTEDLIAPNVVMAKKQGSEGTRPIIQAQVTTGLHNLIQLMEGNADKNSIGVMQLGGAPQGGTPTATQTMQMAKSAEIVLNLFTEMQRMFIKNLSELRIETLLWRLNKEDLSEITVHDKLLGGGKRGSRKYFMRKGLENLKDKERMDMSLDLMKLENKMKGKLEAAVIDPEELVEKMDLFIRVDASPSPRRTSDLDRLMAQYKFNQYAQFPQVFNLTEAAKELAEVMGDDPDTAVKEEQPPQPQPMEAPPNGTPPPMQTEPTMNQALGLPR